jgi:hypothetical protein
LNHIKAIYCIHIYCGKGENKENFFHIENFKKKLAVEEKTPSFEKFFVFLAEF